MELEYDELVSLLIKNVGHVLLDIYHVYFQHEIRGSEPEDKSRKLNDKMIFDFLRDFDICPTLINKGIAYKLFLTSYENPYPIYNTVGMEVIESTN